MAEIPSLISPTAITYIILILVTVWTLAHLPFINPEAAWNLQMNLLDLLKRMEDRLQDTKDTREDEHPPE